MLGSNSVTNRTFHIECRLRLGCSGTVVTLFPTIVLGCISGLIKSPANRRCFFIHWGDTPFQLRRTATCLLFLGRHKPRKCGRLIIFGTVKNHRAFPIHQHQHLAVLAREEMRNFIGIHKIADGELRVCGCAVSFVLRFSAANFGFLPPT